MNAHDSDLRRREFMGCCSAMGLGGTLFPGALLALAQDRKNIDAALIAQAEKLAGLAFSDEQRKLMEDDLNQRLQGYQRLREIPIANSVPPALYFDPLPPGRVRPAAEAARPIEIADPTHPEVPGDLEELAFLPITQLSRLIREQEITSVELTEMYLERLVRLDPRLKCVVTLTTELAMGQARAADAEIAAGKYRGPLHGMPWGAKDLFHTHGIRTTYGTKPFEQQVPDDDATVVERLRDAGAVLIAKLTLGELAMGDVWFGGMTRNPWNPEQGSSGSSAGPACATAAGCVGFALGTETLGSIVSPSTRCGTTGLRPTYGRVSRAGAMALSWSMDKVGPICRSVEDCALVFDAIHGSDPRDKSAVSVPFHWNPGRDLKQLKVGFLKSGFEGRRRSEHDQQTLAALRGLGLELVPIEMPEFPAGELLTILNAEAATAFDELARSGGVDQMVQQNQGAWPNTFRAGQFIPAVEYLRANRLRTLLMQKMAERMDQVDVFVTPPYAGNVLTITNLTGHPCVVLPNGFDGSQPHTITFIGKLYGEADLLAVAKAYQDATDFHRRHPDLQSY